MRGFTQGLVEFLAGAIVGAVFGYVAATLWAPKEGSASRAQLGELAAGVAETPSEYWRRIERRVQQAVAEAQRAAAEARQSLEASAGRAAASAEHRSTASGAI